jgi:alkanesulfonate monooxygenase SsuD/methylene tetrahydromethanopterin reductase-like flavin-dependent oxidoreductase (luciferase family)
MAGVPVWTARERTDRLTEFVTVVDRLLSGDIGDHDGPHYPYSSAAMTPGPVQDRLPLIIAANAPRALAAVAAHGDGWVTFPGGATEADFYEASVRRAQALDEALGGRQLRRILLAYGAISPWDSADAFARLVERYRGIGFDEIVVYAPKDHELPVFEQVAAKLDSYR